MSGKMKTLDRRIAERFNELDVPLELEQHPEFWKKFFAGGLMVVIDRPNGKVEVAVYNPEFGYGFDDQ